MIQCLTVDYIHCVLLGVTRKLIRLRLTGSHRTNTKSKYFFRLSNNQKQIINNKLLHFKNKLPLYFSEKFFRENLAI